VIQRMPFQKLYIARKLPLGIGSSKCIAKCSQYLMQGILKGEVSLYR
jgi:hypothetical protein